MSDNNIFDRVDGVQSSVNDVSVKVDSLAKKIDALLSGETGGDSTTPPQRHQENQQFEIKKFIENSKKEYCYVGDRSFFESEKRNVLIFLGILMGLILLSTILSSCAFGLYSTFTLFENIWLVMLCFICYYVIKAKRHYDCYDFMTTSFFKFILDEDGVPRVGETNTKYKVFLVLTCIAGVCNALCVWLYAEVGLSVLVTIVELAVVGFSVFVFKYKVEDFFAGYYALRFTGLTLIGGKVVSLIYVPLQNKLYSAEEYYKEHPEMQ